MLFCGGNVFSGLSEWCWRPRPKEFLYGIGSEDTSFTFLNTGVFGCQVCFPWLLHLPSPTPTLSHAEGSFLKSEILKKIMSTW